MVTIPILSATPAAPACAPCGGRCCKSMPGGLVPSDVDTSGSPEVLRDKLRTLLQSGRYALDSWVGNPFVRTGRANLGIAAYFVRPAVRGEEGRWFDESWGGACTFHSDAGCSLDAAARPSECRALVPADDGECNYGDSGWEGKRSLAQAWWPHVDVLQSLRDEYAMQD